MRDPGQQAEGILRGATRAGPLVVLAMACIALAGGLVWLAVQREQIATPDRYTGTDHARFEITLETRLARMDRVIDRMESVVTQQASVLKNQESMILRLTQIVEAQTERIRALEEWRKEPR